MLLLWLAAAIAMLLFVGGPDVSRTQEARVLETAREMLASGWRGWIVPHINGQVRLEKPPLAYWLAAVSFKIFGVGAGAGRLPFALIGWLMIGLVYRIGYQLFNRQAGIAAAAALLGSYLFFWATRLAETDGPAALFTTAAVWWAWRGLNFDRWIDLQISAIAVGLILMSKHGDVVYPLLFLVGWIIVERRWADGWKWLASGAPITILIVGAPWWIAILKIFGFATLKKEMHDITYGRDHPGTMLSYIPWIAVAVAPWVGLVVLAVIGSVRQWTLDSRLRFILIWAASILLPLCCIGNKQIHYLLPLMMPLMVLTGWLVRRALKGQISAGEFSWFRLVLLITLLSGPIAAGALFFFARHSRGAIEFQDVVLAAMLAIFCAFGLAVFTRNPPVAAMVVFFAAGVVMPYALGKWAPSLVRYNHSRVAQNLEKKFGKRPICFYGKEESVPLAFALQRIVRQYDDIYKLNDVLHQSPHMLVLIKKDSVPIPPLLKEVFDDKLENQTIRGYLKR
jgi:4-amino-4-deoxy-L-arabinose transferase-like glycosyltransferase